MSTIVQSVEDIKLNNFHRLLSVRSGGGSFVDGYVLSIIGVGMLQITSALHLTNFWQGMATLPFSKTGNTILPGSVALQLGTRQFRVKF